MMLDNVVDRLKELGGMTSYSLSDKREIESLYNEVTGKTFVSTSCNDCYHDAVIESLLYLKKHGKMKEKTIYGLKAGVLLQMEFSSSEFYTNDNLTDEAAETYLSSHPENIDYFAVYPDDWEERVQARKNPSEIYEEVVALMMEASIDGATDKGIMETFVGYEVDGKKLSKKATRAHMKEAYERIANMPKYDSKEEVPAEGNQEAEK